MCLETPSFWRYKENYVTRNVPEKFRDFRETGARCEKFPVQQAARVRKWLFELIKNVHICEVVVIVLKASSMLHQGDLKLRAPFDELLKNNKRGRCAACSVSSWMTSYPDAILLGYGARKRQQSRDAWKQFFRSLLTLDLRTLINVVRYSSWSRGGEAEWVMRNVQLCHRLN